MVTDRGCPEVSFGVMRLTGLVLVATRSEKLVRQDVRAGTRELTIRLVP
jgi:hypothetical protein